MHVVVADSYTATFFPLRGAFYPYKTNPRLCLIPAESKCLILYEGEEGVTDTSLIIHHTDFVFIRKATINKNQKQFFLEDNDAQHH